MGRISELLLYIISRHCSSSVTFSMGFFLINLCGGVWFVIDMAQKLIGMGSYRDVICIFIKMGSLKFYSAGFDQ